MEKTLSELFDFEYGQKEYHNKEWLEGDKGKTILISSKGEDNGIYGFFSIKPKYTKPVITIPSYGTIGQAFVQEYPFAVDDHLLVLIPKEEMSTEQMFQVVYQIRTEKWRYKYGRGITEERIGNKKIKFIKEKFNYSEFTKNNTPIFTKTKRKTTIRMFSLFTLETFCIFEKKKFYPKNAINLVGTVPYVTASSKNNGVSDFTDELPIFNPAVTISINGSVAEVFFQSIPFITSSDNVVMTLKEEYKEQGVLFLIYLASVYKKAHKWRFNYYRKPSMAKIQKSKIPIPVNSNGNIDFELIKNVFEELPLYNSFKKTNR